MISHSKKLLTQLEEQLNFISAETDDILKRAELSVSVCNEALIQLKKITLKYKFKGQAEEILFFRETKPSFYSKLIYHVNVYNIEMHKPNGSEDAKRKYLLRELKVLETFFHKNLDFIKYYRTRKCYLDHKYFVRGKHDLSLSLDSFFFETDPKFSTSHDYKVSQIQAHELLEIFLTAEIAILDAKQDSSFLQLPKVKLTWTSSKASLVELVYALQSTGAFNNSTASVKEIANYFESIFNVDLSHLYTSFQEIKERKNNQTIFMTALQEALLKRIMDAEEKFSNN
jgi:hypothetical protein